MVEHLDKLYQKLNPALTDLAFLVHIHAYS